MCSKIIVLEGPRRLILRGAAILAYAFFSMLVICGLYERVLSSLENAMLLFFVKCYNLYCGRCTDLHSTRCSTVFVATASGQYSRRVILITCLSVSLSCGVTARQKDRWLWFYIDKGILLGTKTRVECICHYIHRNRNIQIKRWSRSTGTGLSSLGYVLVVCS